MTSDDLGESQQAWKLIKIKQEYEIEKQKLCQQELDRHIDEINKCQAELERERAELQAFSRKITEIELKQIQAEKKLLKWN